MSAPASPLLSYSLLCSVGTADDVTYLNTGQPATLTLVVSNPGGAVTLDSLTLAFSLGTDATDLTASQGNITPVLPSQWTPTWGANGLTLTPPGGSIVVDATAGLTFDFQVSAVNTIVGTTSIDLTETTAGQTAYPPPFSIPMVPAGFVLANLSTSPVQIAPGATVTLSWIGTPNQAYTVNYVGGPAAGVSVTAPSGGSVAWTSPAIETAETSATFVVSATVQSVTVEASTTVLVSTPQIVSFSSPGVPSYGDPVPLQWTTINAANCTLSLNGIAVTGPVVANTPQAGYLITPTTPVTVCELYACASGAGGTKSLPSNINVGARLWTPGLTLSGLDPAATNSIALSPNGATLYAAGSTGNGCIRAIATATMTVSASASPSQIVGPIGPNAMALDSTGANLWVLSTSPFAIVVWVGYVTATLDGNGVSQGDANVLAPTCNGNMCYAVQNGGMGGGSFFFGVSPSALIGDYGANPPSGIVSALQLSADGSTLYALGPDAANPSSGSVFTANTSQLADPCPFVNYPQIASGVGLAGFQLGAKNAPNASLLYCCASDGSPTLVPLQLPGGAAQTSIPLFTPPAGSQAAILGLGAEPGGGIFAAVLVSGLGANVPVVGGSVANGLNLFVLNPYTNVPVLVYQNPAITTASSAAIVSDSTGAHVYCAAAGTIVQLVQESASSDARTTSDHTAASSSRPA